MSVTVIGSVRTGSGQDHQLRNLVLSALIGLGSALLAWWLRQNYELHEKRAAAISFLANDLQELSYVLDGIEDEYKKSGELVAQHVGQLDFIGDSYIEYRGDLVLLRPHIHVQVQKVFRELAGARTMIRLMTQRALQANAPLHPDDVKRIQSNVIPGLKELTLIMRERVDEEYFRVLWWYFAVRMRTYKWPLWLQRALGLAPPIQKRK